MEPDKLMQEAYRAATEVAPLTQQMTRAVARVLIEDLHALLFPELHPGYDPDHPFWQDNPHREGCYEWTSDTLDWVAGWLNRLRAEVAD